MSNKFAVGAALVFKGYSQETPNGQLKANDAVTVTELKDDDSYIVKGPTGALEHVFYPDEVTEPAPVAATAGKATKAKTAKADAPAAAATGKVKGAAKQTPEQKAKEKEKKAKEAQKAADKKKREDEKQKRTAEREAAKAAREAEKAAKNAPIEIVDTESVKAILAESGDALAAAMSLKGQIDETYFSLGGVLAHINNEGLYKQAGERYAGDKGYKLYCEEVLEIGYSRAKYWEGIYLYFSGMGKDQEDLAGVGWSKAKELTDLTNDEAKLDEALTYAREHSKAELIEWTQTFRKTDASAGQKGAARGATAEKREKFSFALVAAEAETATGAIKRAMELVGSEDANKAFLHIMTEWAMSVDGAETTLADAVNAVEVRFNTKLVEDLGNGEYVIPGGEKPAEEPAPAAAAPAPAKAKRATKAKAA